MIWNFLFIRKSKTSLEGLDSLSWFDPEKVSFMDKRTGRRLNPENSLLEECVWNGDILEIQGYK